MAERTVAAEMVVLPRWRRGGGGGLRTARTGGAVIVVYYYYTHAVPHNCHTYVVGEEVGGGWIETGREVACERDGNGNG